MKAVPDAGEILLVFTSSVTVNPAPVGTVNVSPKFAFIYNEDEDKDGVSEWFNYKGLTYIEKVELPW